MNKLVLYVHGKGGSPDEAEHYKALFPQSDVLGLDYHAQTPWEANREFPALFHRVCKSYHSVVLIAIALALFAMNSLQGETIERDFFISAMLGKKLLCGRFQQQFCTEQRII